MPRVREGDDARVVPEQPRDAFVSDVEELPDEHGLEVLLDPEVEHHVEGVRAAFRREFGDGPVRESLVLRERGDRDDDSVPVALEDEAGSRVREARTEPVPKFPGPEQRDEPFGSVRLRLRERVVAEEGIGVGQRKVERQGLAGNLDVHRVAARLRRPARFEHLDGPFGRLIVVHRRPGPLEHGPVRGAPRSPRSPRRSSPREASCTIPSGRDPMAPTSASNSERSVIVDGIGTPP